MPKWSPHLALGRHAFAIQRPPILQHLRPIQRNTLHYVSRCFESPTHTWIQTFAPASCISEKARLAIDPCDCEYRVVDCTNVELI